MSAGDVDLSSLLAGLDIADQAVHAAAERGLSNGIEFLLGEMVRVVPIEEGMLQDSGRTEVDGGTLTAAVGFGTGPSAAYAVAQHENLTYQHDPGRQAHYVSGPLAEHRNTAGQIIADSIRDRLA